MKLTDLLFTQKLNDPMAIILSADYKLQAEIELIKITKLNELITSAFSHNISLNLRNDGDFSLSDLVIAYENRQIFISKIINSRFTIYLKELIRRHRDASFWMTYDEKVHNAIMSGMTYENNFGRPVNDVKPTSKELKIIKIDNQSAMINNSSSSKIFKGTVEVKVSDSYAAHLDINLFIAPARGDDHRYLAMTHTRNILTVSYAMYEKLQAIALQHEAESKSAA